MNQSSSLHDTIKFSQNIIENIISTTNNNNDDQKHAQSHILMTPQRKDQTLRKQILDKRLSKTDDSKKYNLIEFSIDKNFSSIKTSLLTNYIDTKEIKYTGCNCRKSQCLKMYCTCFAVGKMCDETCLCDSCKNDEDNMDRSQAINEIIQKDPFAFSKKTDIPNISFDDDFCNCRKSNCTKKYCDCYRRGKVCGSRCNCTDCNNCKDHEKSSNNQNSQSNIQMQSKKKVKRE